MRILFCLVFAGIWVHTNAQDFKQFEKDLRIIPGGRFVMGGGYQYYVDEWRMVLDGTDSLYEAINEDKIAIGEVPAPNVPERYVTLSSFVISAYEVTNREYRDFLIGKVFSPEEGERYKRERKLEAKGKSIIFRDLQDELFRRATEMQLMPDTSCWIKDFPYSYNQPLTRYYFFHPAFNNYPVVGVSRQQAQAYCEWLSEAYNQYLASKGKPAVPDFRLPTEAEWEYAAKAPILTEDREANASIAYPWEGFRMWDAKGDFRANIKADHGDYMDDGYAFTGPVASFAPNRFGLYDMAGNVAEWVIDIYRPITTEPLGFDRKIGNDQPSASYGLTKGGSWADYRYAAQCGSRCKMDPEKGHSRVGFRVVRVLEQKEVPEFVPREN